MAKKRTNQYWIARSNQILAGVHKESDGYIQLINKSYDKALKDTQTDINKIFATYVREHNLTPTEAKKFLNTKISTKEISHLRQKLAQVTNEEIKKSLLAEINANAYKARITRLEALKQSINVNYKVAADKELTLSKRVYIDTIEESYYRTVFNLQKGIDIGFNLAQIPTKTIDVILNTNWSGKLYTKRIWGNNQVTIDKIANTITSGFISGKSIPKMVKEIEDLTEYGKYAAARLIRTECTYFSNQGSMESYRECDVEKYIFVATLDLRTSKQCRKHDRKVYEVSKAMPGENLPPLHVFCRSTTRAYLGEEYMNNIKRRARDPETGKTYLVGNMNYEEWYNQYVKGNPRAELTEQKINNMSADKKQYEKYRNILGKEAPKSIDAFQDLKYTDSKKWEFVKLDYSRRKTLIDNPSLTLPNSDKVVIANEKFTKYLFDGSNEAGLAKGRAFESRLGYSLTNWEELRKEIQIKANQYPALAKGNNGFGERYEQKIIIYGKNGTPANVIVGWMDKLDGTTSMSSTYIKEVQ